MKSWQTVSSKVVYENPWITVHEDAVIKPNGQPGIYGYLSSKSNSVSVIPVDDDGNTWLVQQERYTTKSTSWECVAGRIDGDTVIEAARRELHEETGIEAKHIINLCATTVANGTTSLRQTICLATNLSIVSDQLDTEDGILSIKKVPLTSIPERILSGEIVDSESIAALLTAIAYLNQQHNKVQ